MLQTGCVLAYCTITRASTNEAYNAYCKNNLFRQHGKLRCWIAHLFAFMLCSPRVHRPHAGASALATLSWGLLVQAPPLTCKHSDRWGCMLPCSAFSRPGCILVLLGCILVLLVSLQRLVLTLTLRMMLCGTGCLVGSLFVILQRTYSG